MKFIRSTPTFVVALWLFCAAHLLATEANLAKISSTVAQVFAESHYSHAPMDEAMSGRILNAYFNKLDADHLFFTSQDIARLTRLHAATFGKETAQGDLSSAEAIFNLFKKRVHERQSKIEKILSTAQFDFKSNRSVELSRDNAPWPKDEMEADQLWRDQIEGDLLDDKLEGKNLSLSIQDIRDRYERLEREAQSHSHTEVMADVLSALAHAYDPHSDYLRKQDFEDLTTDMRLSMVGIGISIEPDGRFMKISEVFPSSPAGVDGRLKTKDRILAVAHGDAGFVKIEGMPFDRVMDLLRTRKGSRIQLKVIAPRGDSQPRVVDLIARTIELTDDQAKAEVIERNPKSPSPARLGWLQIPSFYGDPDRSKGHSVARDVRHLLKSLINERIEGLVLDMRGNPGGELEEAVKIGGLFLGKVPIVQEKDGEGTFYISKANTAALYTGPMVVLVDHLTASAAELLAAALQDHGRAIIVGGCSSSFGKGTVQTVVELKEILPDLPKSESFGAIQLTIAKFYRVNGASTQLKGISSDIPLPSPEDLPGGGETSMKNPLAYDEAKSISNDTKAKDALTALMPQLRELSSSRVKADREFRFLLEDLELAKQNANRVSLNEALRRKDLAEEKKRTSLRQTERAHNVSKEKIIPVALNAAQAPRASSEKRNARLGSANSSSGNQPDAVRREALNILEDFATLSKHSAAN